MAEKIKILYLIQLPPPIHGVSMINEIVFRSEKINCNIEKELIRLNFSNSFEDLRKFSIRKFFRFIKIGWQLIRRLIIFKPDYVYFSIFPTGWGYFRDSFYVLIIKFFRITPIFHLHITGIRKCRNKIMKLIYRFTFSKSIVIHLSQGLLTEEILPLKLKDSKFHIVPNGVKPSVYKNKFSVKDNLRLLYVSNILSEKGIFDLIKIFDVLHRKYNNLELSVVGPFKSNTLKKKVSKLIHELELNPYVCLKGALYSDFKTKEYLNADIFFYPTLYDSFPLVLLEAMDFALPIVTTKTGAIPEFLTHEETALLAEYNDVKDIILKTSILIESSELRIALGEKAKNHFNNNFTTQKFEENMEKVFQTLNIKV